MLCDLRGFFVAEIRGKGGCNARAALHECTASGTICPDSCDAVVSQSPDRSLHGLYGLKQIVEGNRLKRVQFHLSCFRRHGDGHIMPCHQIGHLCDNLRNDRIYLARHNGRAVLFRRKADLRKTGFRSGGKEAEIIAHFGEIHSTGFQRSGNSHKTVQVLRRIKQIVGLHKRISGERSQIRNNVVQIFFRHVDGGSDCGSSEVNAQHLTADIRNSFSVTLCHDRIGMERLTQAHRNRVLQLRAPHLNDIIKFIGLFHESAVQPL